MKKLFTTLSFLIFGAFSAFGQSIDSKGFDPETIPPNGQSTYTIVLNNLSGSISTDAIPVPDGLKIIGQNRSQSMSLGSGGMTSQTILSYTVQADKEGSYTIPAWKVSAGSKTFTIAEATLKVDPSAPPQEQVIRRQANPFGFGRAQPRRQTHSSEISLKENIKMEIKLPREKIYVGESAICEVLFTFDRKFIEEGYRLAQLVPQIQDADAFEHTPFTTDNEPVLTADGKTQVRFTTVITPLKAGEYDLKVSAEGAFMREMQMDMDSFFDMPFSFGGSRAIPFELNVPAKKVDILPLPQQGKPANFTGAIGKFALEGVSVEPDALTVGEPCVITAKIFGSGNFQRIGAPDLKTGDDWKSYKPKSSFVDESNGMSNIGIKTFEITAVPNKADLEFAPRVLFNYFDPENGKYVELESKDIPVSVAPTGRSARAQSKVESQSEPEFGHIVENAPVSKESRLMHSPVFWSLQVIIVGAIAAFVIVRRNKLRLLNDPAYAKKLKCKKECARQLSLANTAANRGDKTAFFDHAKQALQNALCGGTEYESSALLLREAQKLMRDRGISEDDIANASVFFEGADAIAFGGIDASKLDIRELNAKLRKLCAEIK